MSLTPFTSQLGKQRAAHLLRRCCWGGSLSEINEFASYTALEAFDKLTDEIIPDPILPIDARGNGQSYITQVDGNYVQNESSGSNENQTRIQQHHHEIGLMTGYGGVPKNIKPAFIFRERVCYMFYTIFPYSYSAGGIAGWSLQQLFRFHAFDRTDRPAPKNSAITMQLNIREMTKKMVLDETIMVQLDGQINFKSNPNENLGRELLELYSIGRGLDGFIPDTPPDDYFTHTEQDVQAASRVLTGWTFRNDSDNFDPETGLRRPIIRTFQGSGPDIAAEHDNSIKQFSNRFQDAQVIPNPSLLIDGQPTEASMLDEIDQLINLIYSQRETARHICRRIYRFFVHYRIDQSLSDDIIEQMADAFIDSGFKLYPVLRLLLTSRHFYDGENESDSNKIGGLIKSPHDLFIGFFRIFDNEVPDPSVNYDDFQTWTTRLRNRSFASGLSYHDPTTVAGHEAYFQFPTYNRSWLTSNWLAERYAHVNESITTQTRPDRLEIDDVEILPWVRANFMDSIAGDARKLVIAIAEYFLPLSDNLSFEAGETSPITVARLTSFLNSFLGDIDANPEEAWNFRYLNQIDQDTVARQLENLFDAVLQSPEYQLL